MMGTTPFESRLSMAFLARLFSSLSQICPNLGEPGTQYTIFGQNFLLNIFKRRRVDLSLLEPGISLCSFYREGRTGISGRYRPRANQGITQNLRHNTKNNATRSNSPENPTLGEYRGAPLKTKKHSRNQ